MAGSSSRASTPAFLSENMRNSPSCFWLPSTRSSRTRGRFLRSRRSPLSCPRSCSGALRAIDWPATAGNSIAPLLIAAAWLLNPAMQNMALFEFHLLPFAIAPLLMAMLAYDQGRKVKFLLWSGLAMLVREDVALVVAMIGLLAWLERKPLWWRIAPAILGAGWFLAAMGIITHFSAGGGYKYGIYYAWLGSSPAEMVVNAVRDPLRLLGHIMSFANLEMALGFLMPLLFLPLLRSKRLVLLLAPLLQIILGAPG